MRPSKTNTATALYLIRLLYQGSIDNRVFPIDDGISPQAGHRLTTFSICPVNLAYVHSSVNDQRATMQLGLLLALGNYPKGNN